MILRLLRRSVAIRKRSVALMVVSVAAGTAVIASFAALSVDIETKLTSELRSFGANIAVEPRVEGMAELSGQTRYLREKDLPKVKTIFWRHNIVGLAPFLEAPVEVEREGRKKRVTAVGTWFRRDIPLPGGEGEFTVGVETVAPGWEIGGERGAGMGVKLGAALAAELGVEPGDEVVVGGQRLRVSGFVRTGGPEDERLFMDLDQLQRMVGLEDQLSRVAVSAITTPMDDFAYRDYETMTPTEYERWYCTAYVTSIAKQLEETFVGSRAAPIWQVAKAEGRILSRLRLLVYLLAAAAFLAGALGTATTMTASFLRRLDEVALMKAIGADSPIILLLFMAEAVMVGLLGGAAGYFVSLLVADEIGVAVFGAALEKKELLLPLALGSALLIAVTAAVLPVLKALKVKAAIVLKEAN